MACRGHVTHIHLCYYKRTCLSVNLYLNCRLNVLYKTKEFFANFLLYIILTVYYKENLFHVTNLVIVRQTLLSFYVLILNCYNSNNSLVLDNQTTCNKTVFVVLEHFISNRLIYLSLHFFECSHHVYNNI